MGQITVNIIKDPVSGSGGSDYLQFFDIWKTMVHVAIYVGNDIHPAVLCILWLNST